MRVAVLGLLMFVATGCGNKEYKWEMYPVGSGSALRMNKETGQTWVCTNAYLCTPVVEAHQYEKGQLTYEGASSGLPVSRPKK